MRLLQVSATRKAITVLAFLLAATFAFVSTRPEPVVSDTGDLRFPLTATFHVTDNFGVSSTVEASMTSWHVWKVVNVDGPAAGYTTIAEPSGRVTAGYDEWPPDEWIELQPAGSKTLPLPNSWLHPYFFEEGRQAPGDQAPDLAETAREKANLVASDEVRAYRSDQGTVAYHRGTGLPLYIAEPGFGVELVAVTSGAVSISDSE